MSQCRRTRASTALLALPLSNCPATPAVASAPDAVGAVGAVDGVLFLRALTDPKARATDMTPLANQVKTMLGALPPAQRDAQAGATALAQVPDTAHIMRVMMATRARHVVMPDDPAFLDGELDRFLVTRADARVGD